MKKIIAMEWIKALKSGKYKQGRGALRRKRNGEYRYCCLGVLQEAILGLPPKGFFLSGEAMKKSGIHTEEGMFGIKADTLSYLNDGEKYSFTEIADVIAKHWKEL